MNYPFYFLIRLLELSTTLYHLFYSHSNFFFLVIRISICLRVSLFYTLVFFLLRSLRCGRLIVCILSYDSSLLSLLPRFFHEFLCRCCIESLTILLLLLIESRVVCSPSGLCFR